MKMVQRLKTGEAGEALISLCETAAWAAMDKTQPIQDAGRRPG